MSHFRFGAVTVGLVLSLGGCSSFHSNAPDLTAAELSEANGWSVVTDVPFERQRDASSCGEAAMSMVLRHFGYEVDQTKIKASARTQGAGPDELRDFARAQGLAAFLFSGDLQVVVHELQQNRPVLVGLPPRDHGAAHYEVVVGYNVSRGELATLDPGTGYRRASLRGFLAAWEASEQLMIAVLPIPELPNSKRPASPPPTRTASYTTSSSADVAGL